MILGKYDRILGKIEAIALWKDTRDRIHRYCKCDRILEKRDAIAFLYPEGARTLGKIQAIASTETETRSHFSLHQLGEHQATFRFSESDALDHRQSQST